MGRNRSKGRKNVRRERAKARQEARNKRTPAEQLMRLDAALGIDQGAQRERTRLDALLDSDERIRLDLFRVELRELAKQISAMGKCHTKEGEEDA